MFEDHAKPVGLEDEVAFETSLLDDADLSQLPEAELLDPSEEVGGSEIIQPNWVGKRFGRFKLQSMLGEGSMGRIILAEDVNLQRSVAIKVLRKRIRGMEESEAVKQFLREARAAAQIDHPNVVRIYEINEHDGWWYIAMELVEGETLAKVIRATGSLSPQRACPIIADAAAALEVAHDMGIVHHDIKPSNLLITRRGRCKITDFGLVRMDVRADPFDVHTKSVGTPRFMAPEVIRRRDQTTAVDIYSLGATLYFALTGWSPFDGKTTREILRQHLRSPAPDIREHVADCSDSLAELVARMLEKDPADRPTAEEVSAALNAEAIDSRNDSGKEDWSWHSGINLADIEERTSDDSHSSSTGSTSAQDLPTVHLTGKQVGLNRNVGYLIAGTIAVIVAVLAAVFWPKPLSQLEPAPPTSGWLELYPNAPTTYGTRDLGDVPAALPQEVPAFSWLNHNPPADALFVAAKQGRFFYRVNNPRAALIHFDNVTYFKTADDIDQTVWRPAPEVE